MNKPLFPDVTVNGATITSAAIGAEAQNHPAPKGKPGLAWNSAAKALVVRQLLLEEAERQSITADPIEVEKGRWETEEEALIRAVTEASVEVTAPTLTEIKAHWAKDPDRYVSPPLWEASHILFAGEGAEERANAAAELLAESPKGFASLARELSDCPSGKSGGTLGQLSPGDTVPEFETVLRSLGEGEMTKGPIQTRLGWHMIRMDGVAKGKVLPFDAVAPRLSEAMEKASWVKGARDFADKLISQAEITGLNLQPVSAEA